MRWRAIEWQTNQNFTAPPAWAINDPYIKMTFYSHTTAGLDNFLVRFFVMAPEVLVRVN